MLQQHTSNVPGAERPSPGLAVAARSGTSNAPVVDDADGGWASQAASTTSLQVERIIQLQLTREPDAQSVSDGEALHTHVGGAETARRVANVLVAALALVALAPLMTLIALAIRLTSRGPVIYVQERVGLDRRRAGGAAAAPGDGRRDLPATKPPPGEERRREDVGGTPYRMYKFRTMRVDAEADGRPVWATREDPRVTRVGRVLRKTRLDELPQLVNVLRGEMNLVGPRPERPAIAARLREEIDGYALRYRVRPGITGWAQINHPYDATIEDVRVKVRYDLEYLGRRGVAEDLRILARTVPVMLGRRHGW